jgi:hypothetical protein
MSFTETEQEAIRMLCNKAAQAGVDEGIRTAAVMIRKAHNLGFPGSLLELADLVERSVSSSSFGDHH